jgi:hypothetical protein
MAMPSPPPSSSAGFYTFEAASGSAASTHPAAAMSQAAPSAQHFAPADHVTTRAADASHPAAQRRRERRHRETAHPRPRAGSRSAPTKDETDAAAGQQSFQLASNAATVSDGDDSREEDDGKHGDRKHQCPECKKRFNRPSSLRIHFNVHDGNKREPPPSLSGRAPRC